MHGVFAVLHEHNLFSSYHSHRRSDEVIFMEESFYLIDLRCTSNTTWLQVKYNSGTGVKRLNPT